MAMRIMIVPKKVFIRPALVLCLALVSIAYVRVLAPGAGDAAAFAPAPAKKPLPVYNVARDDNKIAISFDAAWGDEKTEEILRILDERDVTTTFFLVGYWVDAYPEDVKLIHAMGHEIGNHSATHPYMSKLSEQQMIDELKACSDKVEALTGVPTTLFRPPYGDYNDAVVEVSREQGYEIVQWDVDSLDWKNYGTQPMVDQVLKNVQSGSVILFHNNSEYITQALPTILDQLIAKGYEIVPVSEILLEGETIIDHAGCQHKAGQ
jgi:polysaccharide deacetylase family sporulation protein PdaB